MPHSKKPAGKPLTREQILRGPKRRAPDDPQAVAAGRVRAQADMEAFQRQIEPVLADIERVQTDSEKAAQRVQAQVQALDAAGHTFREHPFRTAIRLARKAGDPQAEAMVRDALAAFRKGEEAEAANTVMVVLTFLSIAAERQAQQEKDTSRASYSKRGKLGAAARELKADPEEVRTQVAALNAKKPTWSATKVNEKVAAEFGIHETTVRRYLKEREGEK